MKVGTGSRIITLLTDFGEEDWFVAAMKGVIATLAPKVRIIDITHQVPPGDIRRGALVWRCVYRSFPLGTVHLGVVDPGVGTTRGVLVVRAGGHLFVAPDNGLLSWVLREEGETAVFQVNREDLFLPEASTTFHGRDIFAPLAARLATGLLPEETGSTSSTPVLLPKPMLRSLGGQSWETEVIGQDRFGNCLTSLTRQTVGTEQAAALFLGIRDTEIILPLEDCYGSVPGGQPLAVWGSCGFLELSVSGGSAARALDLKIGDQITVRFSAESDPPPTSDSAGKTRRPEL